MQRRRFITLLAAASLAGAPAFAQSAGQSLRDAVINQLSRQGFSKIVVSRTWLGRLRFVASNGTHRREIVLNPTTGEVLRDLTVLVATWKPVGSVSLSSPPTPDDEYDDSGNDDDDESQSEDERDGDGGDDGGGDGGDQSDDDRGDDDERDDDRDDDGGDDDGDERDDDRDDGGDERDDEEDD